MAGASVGAAVVAAEAVAGAVGVGVAGRPAVGARVPRALVLGPGRRHWALQRQTTLHYWPTRKVVYFPSSLTYLGNDATNHRVDGNVTGSPLGEIR